MQDLAALHIIAYTKKFKSHGADSKQRTETV
jgi:hypothetical protein